MNGSVLSAPFLWLGQKKIALANAKGDWSLAQSLDPNFVLSRAAVRPLRILEHIVTRMSTRMIEKASVGGLDRHVAGK